MGIREMSCKYVDLNCIKREFETVIGFVNIWS